MTLLNRDVDIPFDLKVEIFMLLIAVAFLEMDEFDYTIDGSH